MQLPVVKAEKNSAKNNTLLVCIFSEASSGTENVNKSTI